MLAFEPHAILAFIDGTVAEAPGCPELSIDIDALWHELDEAIAETEAP